VDAWIVGTEAGLQHVAHRAAVVERAGVEQVVVVVAGLVAAEPVEQRAEQLGVVRMAAG
jgi:hypothetical protein